eukprot:SAG11_NODE_3880_length_2171_cov_2.482625_2_plen_70_part_00
MMEAHAEDRSQQKTTPDLPRQEALKPPCNSLLRKDRDLKFIFSKVSGVSFCLLVLLILLRTYFTNGLRR